MNVRSKEEEEVVGLTEAPARVVVEEGTAARAVLRACLAASILWNGEAFD